MVSLFKKSRPEPNKQGLRRASYHRVPSPSQTHAVGLDSIQKEFFDSIKEKDLEKSVHIFKKAKELEHKNQAKSTEFHQFLTSASIFLDDLYEEINYLCNIRRVLEVLWNEVTSEDLLLGTDDIKLLLEGLIKEGKNIHDIKSPNYFLLELWYQYSIQTIPILQSVKENALIYLNEINSTYSFENFDNITLDLKKQSKILFKSYNVPIKRDEFIEKVVYYIQKNTEKDIQRLRDEEKAEKIRLSLCIIHNDDLQRITSECKFIENDEMRRYKKIIEYQQNHIDYSSFLSQTEKISIIKAFRQFQQSFPLAMDQITANMTLLEKVQVIKRKIQIQIEEDVKLPDILFNGEDIIFQSKIHQIEDKKLIGEIHQTGQFIYKMIEKSGNIKIRELLTEFVIGMKMNPTNIDQYIRKRFIPLLQRIFQYKRKNTYDSTFDMLSFMQLPRKIDSFHHFLKTSIREDHLWCQNRRNLRNVQFRMLICFCLNNQFMRKLFSCIFQSKLLSNFYKKNSFIRMKDSQDCLLRILDFFDKLPFQMSITIERNEYDDSNF